jgi:hypothetical protein
VDILSAAHMVDQDQFVGEFSRYRISHSAVIVLGLVLRLNKEDVLLSGLLGLLLR